jgi:hypothetical protein
MPYSMEAIGALAINQGATLDARFSAVEAVGPGDALLCRGFEDHFDRKLRPNYDEFNGRAGATRLVEEARVPVVKTVETLRYWGADRHFALLAQALSHVQVEDTAYASNFVLQKGVGQWGTLAFQKFVSPARIVEAQAVVPRSIELGFRQGKEALITTSWCCNRGFDYASAINTVVELNSVTMPDAALPEVVHWDHFRHSGSGVWICAVEADPAFTADHLVPFREFTLTIDGGLGEQYVSSSGLEPVKRVQKLRASLQGTLLWDTKAYADSHVFLHEQKIPLKVKIAVEGNAAAAEGYPNGLYLYAPVAFHKTGREFKTSEGLIEVPIEMDFLVPSVDNDADNPVVGCAQGDDYLDSYVNEPVRLVLLNRQNTPVITP